jgi:flagellar basal-body rod modification protein FlgD
MSNSIDAYQQGMSGVGMAPGTAATSAKSSVDDTKEQFLTLLITQLKNQDPLSPADSSQFTNQMMQMGQLEQLFDLNKTMQNNYTLQQGGQIAQYSSLVGKNVVATGNQFQVSATDPGSMNFSLAGQPASANVNVFDQYNNLVRSFPLDHPMSGGNSVAFDGLNSVGQPLSPGYYNFLVDAKDSNDQAVQATTYSTGQISGIRIDNGSPVFQMGNTDLKNTDIIRVY